MNVDGGPLAAPAARRSWWWAVPAAYGLVCAVGAVLAPSSWWAPPFVLAFGLATLMLRSVVPERFRGSWTRSAVILTGIAGCAAGGYAFAVAPWGPSGVAYVFVLPFLVAVTVWTADLTSVRGSERLQETWRQAYFNGRRR